MTPPPTADAAKAYSRHKAAYAAPRNIVRNPEVRLTAHGQDVDATALVAVVDVLVVKALEAVGKRIVRQDRARFNQLKGRPFHEAHVLWPTDIVTVGKATKGAWDVVQLSWTITAARASTPAALSRCWTPTSPSWPRTARPTPWPASSRACATSSRTTRSSAPRR